MVYTRLKDISDLKNSNIGEWSYFRWCRDYMKKPWQGFFEEGKDGHDDWFKSKKAKNIGGYTTLVGKKMEYSNIGN